MAVKQIVKKLVDYRLLDRLKTDTSKPTVTVAPKVQRKKEASESVVVVKEPRNNLVKNELTDEYESVNTGTDGEDGGTPKSTRRPRSKKNQEGQGTD